MADAVAYARPGRTTPTGPYNLERLRGVLECGDAIDACGTRMDARGLTDADHLDEFHPSPTDELGGWALEADRTVPSSPGPERSSEAPSPGWPPAEESLQRPTSGSAKWPVLRPEPAFWDYWRPSAVGPMSPQIGLHNA